MYLADVARPCWLLLPGRSNQDDSVRLAVFGLHHHFKVQMFRILATPLPLGFKAQIQQALFEQKQIKYTNTISSNIQDIFY